MKGEQVESAEALRRSPIDTSKILSENGHIVMDDGPFRSEFRGMGGMNSDISSLFSEKNIPIRKC